MLQAVRVTEVALLKVLSHHHQLVRDLPQVPEDLGMPVTHYEPSTTY